MGTRLITITLACVLAGCATSPEAMSKQSSMDLCSDFDRARPGSQWRENIVAELKARDALTEHEWERVSTGTGAIGFGMSRLALVCAWGRPNDINRSAGHGWSSEQWVYEINTIYEYDLRFAYFEDGKVSSWQL